LVSSVLVTRIAGPATPTPQFSLVVDKQPRPGYNVGGLGTADAPLLSPLPATVRASMIPKEGINQGGQYFAVRLAPSGTLRVTGTGSTTWGSGVRLRVQVYDTAGVMRKEILTVVIFSATTFTSSTFTNTSTSPGAFYLRTFVDPVPAADWGYWLQDLQMTVEGIEDTTVYSPTLTVSPNSVTRGETVTVSVIGAPPGATFSLWKFTSSDGLPPVLREVGVSNSTWVGKLVDSGSVSVTVGSFGQSFPISINVSPVARAWAKTPPSPAVELDTDFINCADGAHYPANPPKSDADKIGSSCAQGSYTFFRAPTIDDNGPNQGYRYLASMDVSDIVFRYVISPALRDVTSPFYLCQTGTPPIIRGSDLANGIRRHEGGTVNSHYIEWANAWATPANNYGTVAEAYVTGPVNDATFDAGVNTLLAVVTANLSDATAPEPCSANYDDACVNILGLTYFCIQ